MWIVLPQLVWIIHPLTVCTELQHCYRRLRDFDEPRSEGRIVVVKLKGGVGEGQVVSGVVVASGGASDGEVSHAEIVGGGQDLGPDCKCGSKVCREGD